MLSSGSRLGSYEIVGSLGAGGMGEVYRARDTQLKRDVAIKILPADVTADADRLGRFQREAEMLASLNHANIAQVFGIAEADPSTSSGQAAVRGMVMELVEGETLAQLLTRGSLPFDEALGIARQIAEALEAAHDRGIVHRDLKPANVMLTSDGVVKVLDFGLAKALSPATDVTAQAATFSSPAMTRAGIILGTAAYMSPEQARGRAVDARTDIWAFGCVLFEMLTARRPFDGETVTDILGAIVHKEPEWNLLPATLPDSLRRMLERCLAKDQKQRLRNIADVRLEIQDLLTRPRSAGSATTTASGGRSITARETIAWGLAAASLVAAAAAVWLMRAAPAPIAGDGRLRVSIVHAEGSAVGVPAISPDGRRVAYPARGADGIPMIWVRDLDQSAPKPLAGTEGGVSAFWSPDSKRLGFLVGNVLKHVSADGGPVQELARRAALAASWGVGDVVVFTGPVTRIHRIAASGGPAVAVTTLQGPDWGHYWPSMLPDGRHFLFTAKHWAGLAETGAQGIYLGSIDDPAAARQLLPELSNAVYAAPGYVAFARNGQLMAAPFDLGSLRITGEPVALGEAVAVDDTFYAAGLSAAANGTLAIRPPPAPAAAIESIDAELTLLKRDGSVASRFGGVQKFVQKLSLSPDGRTVAALVLDARTSVAELWRVDVESGARVPLTTMRTSGGYVGSPVFAPDGTRLAYGCQPPKILDDVCVQDMRTGTVTTVTDSPTIWEHPVAWSADGQYMLVAYNEYTESSREELRVWSAKTNTLRPYAKSFGLNAVISQDGRFVAFNSPESGRAEVHVTTFPERQQTWPLTTDGGSVLSWSADGREMLVATLSGHIVAYPVSTSGGRFTAGAPQVLIRNVGGDAAFARATRDHSRILIRVPKDADKDKGEIKLLFGWQR